MPSPDTRVSTMPGEPGPSRLARCVIERSLAAIECTADSSARGLHFVDISRVELYSYALHNARTARPRRVSLREHFRCAKLLAASPRWSKLKDPAGAE